MCSVFRFDKQSHVTEIVNVWLHNQLLLLSLNSWSTCFGSKLSACFRGTWVGLNVMFTWNMAGLKRDFTLHMAGIYIALVDMEGENA